MIRLQQIAIWLNTGSNALSFTAAATLPLLILAIVLTVEFHPCFR